MKRSVLAVASLLLLASPLLAQEPAEQETGLVQITPKDGGWVITELFRTISEYTGESIVYDPNNPGMKKKIQFEGVQTVPRDKLFEWFQSLLSFQRLILVPVGPEHHEQWMALDVNAPQIQSRPIFVSENQILEWADRDGVYVVTTITVKNLTDTSRARNALAQLTTRQIGRINDVPGNLAFVVADFAPVVASMYKLLKAMDVQPMEYTAVGETYLLKHAVATEVEPILLDLLQTDQQVRQVQRGAGTAVPTKPEPRIIADTRQDAIIVYAVPEDHERIAELIELLDQQVLFRKGNIHIRPVKHTNAAELADILTELIRGTGLGTGGSRTTARPSTRRPGQPASSAGALTGSAGEPIIVADTRTNSLLIQATTTQLKDLDDIIDRIDVPRDQVLVEAALVELAIDDVLRFGVELMTATPESGDKAGFARSSFGLTSITDTNDDGIPDINIPNFTQGGLTAGIFNKDYFPVVLQALSSATKARALSMPSAVVEDGSQARMTVTDQVPFQIRSTDQAGNTNFSVDFTEAEITLDISPHISSDNYLRLHIVQTVQSFRGQTSPDLPPPKTGREIETDIVIPDGYTVIMGGLIQDIDSETEEGIPLLKDIPVLGYLFRSVRQATTTTSLFLFVTPHILKNRSGAAEFADYHRVTWERKLLADKLLDEAVKIHHSRFKGSEDQSAKPDELEQIQDSGYLDKPRYKSPPRPELNEEDAWKRFEELSGRKEEKGEKEEQGKKEEQK